MFFFFFFFLNRETSKPDWYIRGPDLRFFFTKNQGFGSCLVLLPTSCWKVFPTARAYKEAVYSFADESLGRGSYGGGLRYWIIWNRNHPNNQIIELVHNYTNTIYWY